MEIASERLIRSAGSDQQLGRFDRAFFGLNPFGRRVVRGVEQYVAQHGAIGSGTLPVVVIPGFLNDASDLRGMRYFLRGLGFNAEIAETQLRIHGIGVR